MTKISDLAQEFDCVTITPHEHLVWQAVNAAMVDPHKLIASERGYESLRVRVSIRVCDLVSKGQIPCPFEFDVPILSGQNRYDLRVSVVHEDLLLVSVRVTCVALEKKFGLQRKGA